MIRQWSLIYDTPKAQQPQKIDKLEFHPHLNFCTSKDKNERVGKNTTEWEKVFASHKSDKGFISKIYKEHLQVNNKRVNNSTNGQGNWTFFQRRYLSGQ